MMMQSTADISIISSMNPEIELARTADATLSVSFVVEVWVGLIVMIL